MLKLFRTSFLLLLVSSFLGAGAEAAFADTLAISSVTATPNATDFTVQWTTNVAGSSQVSYGDTSAYGNSTTETDLSPRVTLHSVTVTGLQACTTYHYQAISKGASYADPIAISDDSTVTTAGCANATAAPADATLAGTGPDNGPYLLAIISMLAIILSITQLNRQRSS